MNRLKDVVGRDGIQTGPFGSQLHADEYSDVGVPVVMPQDLGENVIATGSIARVPRAVAERLPRHWLKRGDIVFSRRGDVTRRAWVRPENEGWLCGTGCLRVRPDPEIVDSRFLSYALGAPTVREWLRSHAVGATMPNLNTAILGNVALELPDLATQTAIAEVLGSLDDKIAANERVVRFSEELLRAEFRQLRADAVERRAVGEIVEFNPFRPKPTGPDAAFVEMKDLGVHTSVIRTWSKRKLSTGPRFRRGDTLLARITPCLENGKVGYVDFLEEGAVASGSTEFVVMSMKDGLPEPLAFLLADDDEFRTEAIQHMTGTSGRQRVAASDLRDIDLALPSVPELKALGDRAVAVFAMLAGIRDENQVLASVRDALLPALMSGAVAVRELDTSCRV